MAIDRLQVLAIIVSVCFLAAVLELVRRRRLVAEYAFLWIAVTGLIVTVSIWRELLHASARYLGVSSPPNVLLIALTAAVLFALLSFSVILSRQRTQIDRLLEDTAVLSAELRDLRAARDVRGGAEAEPGGPYGTDPSRPLI